ncbi:MAG: hypothetical protein WA476_00450 [Acidobacteriaceae bacterium]
MAARRCRRNINQVWILHSDIVRLHGVDGTIEIVAGPENPTPDTEWYIQGFGGGS